MAIALSLVLKATIVLLAGLAITRLCRRAPASIRHLILASTFGALIAMPPYEAFGPTAVVVPLEISIVRDAVPDQTTSPMTTDVTMPSPSVRTPTRGRGLSVGTAIVAVWAAGAAILIGALLLALWRLGRLTRSALPWPEVTPRVDAVAREAGVRRSVETVLHDEITVPMTWGWRRPVILLPLEAREWTEPELRQALLHEMEHVYRNDWIAQLMARMGCTIYWFHPLVWMAMRRLCLEAERACDDAVVRTADRAAYADQLVSLAERMRNAPRLMVPAMARRTDLTTRVRALLDGRQRRGRAHPLPHAAAIAVMCLAVFTIGPVRAVEREPTPRRLQELHRAPWASAVEALLGNAPARTGKRGLALVEAAGEGDIDGIHSLIAAGVDVNSVVLGDGSPLIAAARGGHREAVEALLERGADVDMGVPGDGNPLIMAARAGHLGIVDLLLSRGAGIDTVVDGDENALIQASGAGRLPVVQLLVSRGADVNARVWAPTSPSGGEWRTPLSMALRGRSAAVVDFLRSAGARE